MIKDSSGTGPTIAMDRPPPATARLSMLANSLTLIGAKVATMGLGFLFWVLAARLYSKGEVGVAAGVVAAMMLCTQLSLMGVGSAIITLLPLHERAPERLLNTSFTLIALTSGVCALLFLALASGLFAELDVVGSSPRYAGLFLLATILGTAGILLDQASTALRRGDLVLMRGAVFGVGTVLGVLALGPVGVDLKGSEALLAPWVLAGAAGGTLGWVQLRRLLEGYKLHLHIDRRLAPEIVRVGIANWALTLAERAPGLVLPVVVAELLSPEANATWYLVWMMAWVIYIVPIQVGMTVFAEVATDPTSIDQATRHGIRSSLVVGGLGAGVVIAGAGILLRVLGAEYANEGVEPLRILVLGFLPMTFIQVYFASCRATRLLGEATAAGWIIALTSVGAGAYAGATNGLTGMAWAWIAVQCLGGTWALIRLLHFNTLRLQTPTRPPPVSH